MNKKRIVFVHLLNDFSGSPKVLSQVIRGVHSKHETGLFTAKSESGFLNNVADYHQTYFYKRYENKILTLISFLISQASLFFKIIAIRKSIDVVYINTMLPFGAALAGKLTGKEVIYHIHETSIKPKALKVFLRKVIQISASRLIYVSESLLKEENFSGIKQQVVYNALEEDFKLKSNKSIRADRLKDQFNVLMLCSLKVYKGVEEFVDVAKKCDSHSISFTLVLNAEMNEIRNYFSGRELPSNIILKSKQSDVHPFYAKADLVLNLSRPDEWVETFGLTIIEAMTYGIPVIVPPVGGPAEIVRDGVEGYLISSYNVSKISNRIIELSEDYELYKKLSENALQRSLRFNEDTFHKEILEVIND
ncbi:glycosyltransferase family 4 protein [Salinimicrobium sp. TH3]|uniref:glycosyltransferase family 4 protein n=1 Tax=Salinimicrobium sp. TH3 TaxID=2997342 RepID=UPI002275DB72|nr:glycosyltransferase family 4 protein [Salinimicrobium sp. TH3]MCY2687792.1 glycosyltransferase family 4 protein [Salinimicrobium sp. TH3]